MKNLENAKSILVLKQIVIDKLGFERFSDEVSKLDNEAKINFSHNIVQLEDNTYRVSLGVIIFSEEQMKIEVKISGIFSVSEKSVLGEKVLKNNTVAILFPYLRSQISLLTSQPGFSPVVFPAMNINALLNDEE